MSNSRKLNLNGVEGGDWWGQGAVGPVYCLGSTIPLRCQLLLHAFHVLKRHPVNDKAEFFL